MTEQPVLHPLFRDGPPPEAKLWRYLSFAKFASVLDSGLLHFTRVDRFDDHFEGAWPLANGLLGAHIRNMKRERYEARALGWHVVRIDPNGTETTVEVWPEEKAKHRAAVLDQRAAESFEAEQKLPRKGRDE